MVCCYKLDNTINMCVFLPNDHVFEQIIFFYHLNANIMINTMNVSKNQVVSAILK